MSKHLKIVTAALTVIILAALVAVVMLAVSFFSYSQAASAFPEDARLTLYAQADGSLLLQWPEADKADHYLVELLFPAGSEQPVESLAVSESSCVLPELPRDLKYSIRVTSQRGYLFFWQPRMRDCKNPLQVDCTLCPPEVSSLSFVPDPESKTTSFDWSGTEGDVYRLYLLEPGGSLSLLRTLNESAARLSFGPGGDLEMPGYDEEYVFVLDAYRESGSLVFYGLPSDEISLVRDDLLDTALTLECTDEGRNSYTLAWNEVKGERYELQLLDDAGQWVTLREYGEADELVYSTGHLASFTDYALRVVAYGAETLPDSEFSAVPATLNLYTRESALYAAIWPLKDLELYAGTDRQEVIGKVAAATQLCVLDEVDDLFYVRTEDGYGYIESTYCLIDLADYVGELCRYDITNSYSSLYMVHEYGIPQVTDTVVEGYENVALYDGTYLVPLIYPAAQKLVDAALAAKEDGYRLKIYDAYRPNRATRSIYDLTSLILADPIPEETFSGKPVDDLPEPPAGQELTYGFLMTNGTYSLGNFLASRGSYHNIGIAMDLTLEKLSDGEELNMQSSMHDLSWYSALSNNNENAELLRRYMTGAGFNGLSSEWWHFQDDESRIAYGINSFLWTGVSPEGWRADDGGWKYRRSDGSYYVSTTAAISGVSYIFDESGYAAEAE